MQSVQNVVLVIHLILALVLIGAVLMQRSEGGGLGLGGGGGVMSGRSAATALGKATWIVAGGFVATSITLTILAAEGSRGSSVMSELPETPIEVPAATLPATPDLSGGLLPGSATDTAPASTAPASN